MKKIPFILLLAVVLFSCKKYQNDNYPITFRKPQKKIVKKWDFNMVVIKGEDKSKDFESYTLNFQENGRVIRNYNTVHVRDTYNVVDYGNWRLVQNDNELNINFENSVENFEILELTSQNLALKSINLDSSVYIYFSTAD